MVGVVAERVRELVRYTCKEQDVEIIKGHVSKDHVHLFVSVPPHLAILGQAFVARGYFVATSGNVTDEIILEYIKNQDENTTDENFTVSDGLQQASAYTKSIGLQPIVV